MVAPTNNKVVKNWETGQPFGSTAISKLDFHFHQFLGQTANPAGP